MIGFVENYAEITPTLHAKTRHPRRQKLAAARIAAANFARRLSRVFACNFGVMFNQIDETFVLPQEYCSAAYVIDVKYRARMCAFYVVIPAAGATVAMFHQMFQHMGVSILFLYPS